MNSEKMIFVLQMLTIFLTIFSLIFTSAIVWRVEKTLDISYKFFWAALFAFALAEVCNFIDTVSKPIVPLLETIFYFLFILFFFAGIMEMRRAVRRVDGELPEE